MKRKPVMVFAGSFWAGSTERALADGLRALGWVVQEIDSRDLGVNAGRHLGLRLAARAFSRTAGSGYRAQILDSCQTLKPDIFLTVKGVGITTDLLRRIRETGARTVMFYPDVHFDHPGVSPDSFSEYDLFGTTKSFQLDYLEKLLGKGRVAYIPHGYVDDIHRPIYTRTTDMECRVDVLHVGNHSDYKQRWLEEILTRLPEHSVEIIGNRWRDKSTSEPLSRSRTPGARVGVAYAEALQSARINVAVHHGPDVAGRQDLVSTRTFEIPACQGFMLHIDNDEVREFYKVGAEIDVFSSPDELADKIRFYIGRPELRTRMVERAYDRCVPAYSYAARARQISETLFLRGLI